MTNTWKKGEMTLTYFEPTIKPYEEHTFVSDFEDALYFYYHVNVQHGDDDLFHTEVYEFPKVQHLPTYIDNIMAFNMDNAYLLENTTQGDFSRQVRYHQMILNDGLGLDYDYFYKLERYDYKVSHEHETNEFTYYTLTIGHMSQSQQHGGANREDFGPCVIIKDIDPDELIALKETALSFCQHAINHYNQSH